jgi:hypothetical protein
MLVSQCNPDAENSAKTMPGMTSSDFLFTVRRIGTDFLIFNQQKQMVKSSGGFMSKKECFI